MLQFLKRSLLTLFFLGMAIFAMAQDQRYFVYIQSDRSQPFYVRYNGKLIPSSDKGYVILSKMPAGTAALRIGFAKSDAPERQYLVRITGPADQGFLLKPDGNRGYSLFNLQTFAVIRPSEGKGTEEAVAAKLVTEPMLPGQTVMAAANTPETATVAVDTAIIPVPPVAYADEEKKQEMMESLKKDLDAAFPEKSGVVVGQGTRPVRQGNKFSQALDRVVSDDRPDDIELEQPTLPATIAPAAEVPTVAQADDSQRRRRRRREREPLTEEEKQLASAILAEENRAAAQEVDMPAVQPAKPVADEPVPVAKPAPADAVEVEGTAAKRAKKPGKKTGDDPAFIDFVDTGGHQAPLGGSAVVSAPAREADAEMTAADGEEAAGARKRKKRSRIAEKIDTIDMTERPDNVVHDPTGYEVSDLSIDHPKGSKKDRKKKKGEDTDVAAPVVEDVAPVSKGSSLKMINSDCGKVMDDDTFRKMLRKFVSGKDDDAMVETFKKQTKGYCLETCQIRTLVQLLGADDSRYRLLDAAYPKAYHSDEYGSLESFLSDSYYRGRFRAMVYK